MRSITRVCCLSSVAIASMMVAAPASAASEKVFYAFHSKAHGRLPRGGLVKLGNYFYGVTESGGTGNCGHGCGTVFRLSLDGHQTVIHDFVQSDGYAPIGGLVALNGVLYGTAVQGGSSMDGTVFALTPQGAFSVIHNFTNSGDGIFPIFTMVTTGGVLYGTTESGTVFSVTSAGVFTTLHQFDADERMPGNALVVYQGALYGTTTGGGASNSGTVFKLSLTGTETILHSFTTGEGASPECQLTPFSGKLYGTTNGGGPNYDGTVFSITLSGDLVTLYNFTGAANSGLRPTGNLIEANGLLYGTTGVGGDTSCNYGCGTIFSVAQTGAFTQLYTFKAGTDGANPDGALMEYQGVIYGETFAGGSNSGGAGAGTVFAFSP